LFGPADLGRELKPFVFLDYLRGNIPEGFGFGMHPHSGIATLTYQLNVDVRYRDTEGHEGVLKATGLEWMRAGGGAWHGGYLERGGDVTGFQLWVALPPGVEDGASFSQYVAPDAVPSRQGLKVLLGSIEGLSSPIRADSPMNYCDLSLKQGESYRYLLPSDHSAAWAFVYVGDARVSGVSSKGELLVFEEQGDLIEFEAESDCRILFGSAVPHPHPLILGQSSVHTNPASLKSGVEKINRLGLELERNGKMDW
jgi:redox-sensitive bicupin YhaK (pirin superfamily)